MSPLLLTCALLAWPLRSGAQDYQLPFSEHLDPDQNVTLKWGFDQTRDEITFELTVNTAGWVGLGFSPNGGMAGSDIVIGGVAPNGSVYFTDRYAVGKSLPLVDPKQSYTLLSLTETGGQTTMKFQRPIQSCDANDFPITATPIKLIYAFGLTDEISYHADRRGTKEVNLLKYSPRTSPPSSSYFDITANNFTVPPVHTYYHCRVVELVPLGGKHHVYRIEPVIQNYDLVHHMLLYRCNPIINETFEGMCYSGQHLSLYMCQGAMATWAVGGGGYDFPEVAGISIGGENDVSYYRLEIHYNNPQQIAGRVDDSGLRFYYTPNLREYDASILEVGLFVDNDYIIPPNATSFKSFSLCDTLLFPKILPGPVPELNVFMALLHTHLAGREIRVGHFRNGEQIDFLALDENYDFELQQPLFLGKTKTIKLGDELVVECTYSTVNRTRFTELGLATTDEMCLVFLYYYPAIDVSNCWSKPDIDRIEAAMGAANHSEAVSMYESMTWDAAAVEHHQNALKSADQLLFVDNDQSNYAFKLGAKIRDLEATPTVDCRVTQGGVTPMASATTLPGPGVVLLLLWVAARCLL